MRALLALLSLTFFGGIFSGGFLGAAPAHAHEVRPGYIEITETSRDNFDIIWKQPVRDGTNQVAGLGLRPIFPAHCTRLNDSTMARRPGVLIESFALYCDGGLLGHGIGVEGLQKTITDVIVRLVQAERTTTLRLTAQSPRQAFSGGAGVWSYFRLGLEHLAFGFDHILFVLGLVLLVAGVRRLVLAISGFTLAHSMTLALSALGAVSLSPPLVEALIALSLIFVAVELARPKNVDSIARRRPQIVAFLFGLLHGFGFAGVLVQIGLPRDATLWALALFNIGLEVGQLIVVALALAALALMRSLSRFPNNGANNGAKNAVQDTAQDVLCVLIGGLGIYWFITRSALLF